MFARKTEEGVLPHRPRRSVPVVIIILIIAAVAIKIQLYSWQFFQDQRLGGPLPVAPNPFHDASPHQEQDETFHLPTTAKAATRPTPYSKPNTGGAGRPPPNKPIDRPPGPPHRVEPPRTKHNSRKWQVYKTESFKAANVSITKIGDYTPGYFFFTPATLRRESTAPLIMTDDNELVWRGPSGVCTNHRVQQFNGSPHISYWQTEDRMTQGHAYGAVYIMNSSYDIVHKICPQNLNIVTNDGLVYECYLDMHLSLITERDTLMVTAYNVTQWDFSPSGGPPDGWVYDAIFFEIDIKTKEILYRWRSLDHIDEIPMNLSKMPFSRIGQGGRNRPFGETRHSPWDYFHINSAVPFDDGYLINSRATWSVIKIHKNGSLDWRLQGEDGGDFTLGDGVFFSWQHDSRVIKSTRKNVELMMFNNGVSGYSRRENASHALHLSLDLEKRHCTLVQKLIDHSQFDVAMAMGNWQKLPNEHVFVNYGYAGVMKEFDQNNRVVFNAWFGTTSFTSFAASFSAFRLDWHGTPRTLPKAVAEYSEELNETSVFMSWNGATEYDTWTVSSGKAEDKLSVIDMYDREGFETKVVLEGKHNWVQVEAGEAFGPLRSSKVIETVTLWVNKTETETGGDGKDSKGGAGTNSTKGEGKDASDLHNDEHSPDARDYLDDDADMYMFMY